MNSKADKKFMVLFDAARCTLSKLPIKLINKIVCALFTSGNKEIALHSSSLSCNARVIERQFAVKSEIRQDRILKYLHVSRRWLKTTNKVCASGNFSMVCAGMCQSTATHNLVNIRI